MNSKIATMGLFGVLMVAAFAGIAVSGDDSDAEASVLKYTVGTTVYSETVAEGVTTVTLKDLSALGYTLPSGKTFKGWAGADPAQAVPTTIYSAGSTYAVSSGLTLWAVIEDVTYTVTFEYADGTAILSKAGQTYDADLTLPAKATSVASGKVLAFREVDGQIFAGWALKSAPTEVVIASDVTKIKVSGDASYVAVYQHDPILTFVVDGTTILKHTEYGAVLPADPSKEGFSFVGWSDGDQTILSGDLVAYIAKLKTDVVLDAVWEPAVYTVSFVVDGQTVLTQSVKHGETATEPKIVPAKDGFSFSAWTVDGRAFDFKSPVTGDLTVTASFDAVPAPAPTGLKDPTTQMLAIILGTLILAIIALAIWKREAIRSALVKRLDKGNKGNGGDSA